MTYVVHLEDDETLQEILKVAFQATDPKVNLKQFINGDDAFEHIQPNLEAIDLFVLDIRVPGSIDGIGVARKIRESGCDAPIIMTSAYRQPEREVVDSLGLEWMSKPWHIMEISQRLITLARNRRAKANQATAEVAAAPAATMTPPAPAAPPVQTVLPPSPTVKPPEPQPVVPTPPITPSI
jgi:DNA-binding response OmpR family regulator